MLPLHELFRVLRIIFHNKVYGVGYTASSVVKNPVFHLWSYFVETISIHTTKIERKKINELSFRTAIQFKHQIGEFSRIKKWAVFCNSNMTFKSYLLTVNGRITEFINRPTILKFRERTCLVALINVTSFKAARHQEDLLTFRIHATHKLIG